MAATPATTSSTNVKRSTPFTFDAFYRAFSKSIAVDAALDDAGERTASLYAANVQNSSRTLVPETATRMSALDASPLPPHIAALAALQDADGSWQFTPAFAFVLNGVAPAPPEGIASKTWATCICICLWRQSPEHFAQLDGSYEAAMLHCDNDVLRRVQSLIDYASVHNIRPYNDEEARAVREQLARDAAAKREREDAEDRAVARAREELAALMEMSVETAQRLPRTTQSVFVRGLRSEVRDVFPSSKQQSRSNYESNSASGFQSGDVVECCWRRRDRSAARACKQDAWYPCTVTAVNSERRSVHVQFLDGDCERERSVALQFIRRRPADERAMRDTAFERLSATWQTPIACAAEVARLEELQARKRRPQPWNGSTSQPSLPRLGDAHAPSGAHSKPAAASREAKAQPRQQQRPLTFSAGNRAAIMLRAGSASRERAPDAELDALSQHVCVALAAYDRALTCVRASVKRCARSYATAVLFTERFHAFDDFGSALVVLMRCTTDALDCIAQWQVQAPSAAAATDTRAPIFVWHGSNFVVSLSRSLDFLADYRELVEWYGDEFPLETNPFMLAQSLADRAEDMGLAPAVTRAVTSYSLRDALRQGKKDTSDLAALPTWWPQSQYDAALLARIARAETFVIQGLLAAGELVASRLTDY